jgi:uncharacterized protein YjbI with pentapeptide repeats
MNTKNYKLFRSLIVNGITTKQIREADFREADFWGADFRGADFRGADFREADFRGADFREANFREADFREADFWGANFREANFREADFREADFRGATFRGVDFRGVDFRGADFWEATFRKADFRGVDFWGANFREADFREADLSYLIDELTFGLMINCPEEGSFVGWKKCEKVLVKLLITEDAKRSSATSYKCRCSKALVLDIENGLNEVVSNYDQAFIYRKGEVVEVTNFDENRWNECSTGIHFFMNKEMAKNY